MLDRRRFLINSGLVMLASRLPSVQAATITLDSPSLLFGYPPGAIGTELALGCVKLYGGLGGTAYTVVNIEGRNTRDATVKAKNSRADGSVLLQVQSTSMVSLPNVYNALGYDPLVDFVPVCSLADMTLSFTVGPAVPASVTTLDQYLRWVNENLEVRDIGFSIYGSQGHIATLMVASLPNAPIVPRPYAGSSALLKDLMSGSLAAGFTAAGNGNLDFWKSGKLRSLGVTSAQRLLYWPTIATLAEQGLTGMDLKVWYSWLAPAAIPSATLASLRDTSQRMKQGPGYAALMKQLLLTPLDLTPDEVTQRTAREIALYGQLTHKYNIRQLE